MISLEERKKSYLGYITEEYRPKEKRWWQNIEPLYITTKEFCKYAQQHPPGSEETVIEFDLKRALTSSALFFILLLGAALCYYIKNKGDTSTVLLVAIAYLLFMIYNFSYRKKHDVQIRMDKNGIWLDSIQKWINWNQFLESYVKITEDEGSRNYSLVIHYYDSFHDRFLRAEADLDGLNISAKKIVAELEYRKRIA